MRLRDVEFTDLYLSEKGDCQMRGMKGSSSLSTASAELQDDLRTFSDIVKAKGKNDIEFSVNFDGINFRVSRIDSIGGKWYAIRRPAAMVASMKELGFSQKFLDKFLKLGKKYGLILLSGPTGSGKTTSASAMVKDFLEAYGDVAVTIEDPPELPLDGAHGEGWCFQTPIDSDEDFGDALVRCMRYQPKIIFLGEIRTAFAARQMLRASVNGHIVIATIHAGEINDTLNSIMTFISGDEREHALYALAEGLVGVINQRLVKTPTGNVLKYSPLIIERGSKEETAIRSKIRTGKFEQLSTEIQAQKSFI